jgi:hypothetical protein
MRRWALCLLMTVSERRVSSALNFRDAEVLEARTGSTNRGNPARVESFPTQHRLQELANVLRGVEREVAGVVDSSAGRRCETDGRARATCDCPRDAPAVYSTQRRVLARAGDDGVEVLKAVGTDMLALRVGVEDAAVGDLPYNIDLPRY